ncbi:hypothetical protein LY76DRAFT_587003 [Colletotrichum caudatum]|nr:hypothetical protein LY76DRAFT_587003 [Colletotrichum caudatum]
MVAPRSFIVLLSALGMWWALADTSGFIHSLQPADQPIYNSRARRDAFRRTPVSFPLSSPIKYDSQELIIA